MVSMVCKRLGWHLIAGLRVAGLNMCGGWRIRSSVSTTSPRPPLPVHGWAIGAVLPVTACVKGRSDRERGREGGREAEGDEGSGRQGARGEKGRDGRGKREHRMLMYTTPNHMQPVVVEPINLLHTPRALLAPGIAGRSRPSACIEYWCQRR